MRLIITILISCIAGFFSTTCSGQTLVVDSLKKSIERTISDTGKISSVVLLAEESINPDSLLRYVVLAEFIAGRTADKRQKDRATYCRILYYARKNISDSALLILDGLLPSYIKNSQEQAFYLKLLFLKSKILDRSNQYTKAISLLLEVLETAESLKDTLVQIQAKTGIGWVQMEMEQYKEALHWLYIALHTSADKKFYKNYGALYSNLATAHNSLGNTDSAIYYINISIKDARENDNLTFLATALSMQAKILIDSKRSHLAEVPLKEVVDIRKKMGDPFYVVYDMSSLASYYASNKQPEKGIALCKEGIAIAKEKGLTSQLLMIYQSLAENYKAAGEIDEYSETLEKVIHLKDSFNSINSSKLISEIQASNEVQRKEKQILEQKLTLTQKNYWLYGSALFGLMLGLTGWLAFRSYRRRQQLKMQMALKEEKRNAADAVKQAEEKERVRIAADLHDNLGAYAASMASNLSYIRVGDTDERTTTAFNELKNNSTAIISQLNDTIWVLKKEVLSLTAISDRIKVFVSRIQKSYPYIQVEVNEQIETDHQLPSSQAFHLYRIMQEAINNSLKHSKGEKIRVNITGNSNWKVLVEDDGKGIEMINKSPGGGGNGLNNMKERCREAGWFIHWENGDSGGTIVEISPTTN